MPAYFSPDACFCPLCGKKFNARAAWKHINDYHPKASEKDLKIIRDAKREKVPFATKPVRATKSSILCQPYWSSGPDYSGGLPSLGKKR